MPLAERFLRRIRLNDAGQALPPLLPAIDQSGRQTGGTRWIKIKAGSGSLEVAACPCIGLYRLPPLLHAFQQAFPGITVRVRHESHGRVHQAVLNNRVDIGLVPYPRRGPAWPSGSFRRVPLVLVCHPANPLAALPVVTVQTIEEPARRGLEPDSVAVVCCRACARTNGTSSSRATSSTTWSRPLKR
jgi:DNA-binding transcriptional LysR family regulator